MSVTRRVLTIDGAGRIAVVEDELDDPGAGEILIRVGASMVSPGSELGRVADSPPISWMTGRS